MNSRLRFGEEFVTRDMLVRERLLANIFAASQSLVLEENRSRVIVESEERKFYGRLSAGVRRLAYVAAVGTAGTTIEAEEQESLVRAALQAEEPPSWAAVMALVEPSMIETYNRTEERTTAYETLREMILVQQELCECDIRTEQHDEHESIVFAMRHSLEKVRLLSQWRLERREETDLRWALEEQEQAAFDELRRDIAFMLETGDFSMMMMVQGSLPTSSGKNTTTKSYAADIARQTEKAAKEHALRAQQMEREREQAEREAREAADAAARAEALRREIAALEEEEAAREQRLLKRPAVVGYVAASSSTKQQEHHKQAAPGVVELRDDDDADGPEAVTASDDDCSGTSSPQLSPVGSRRFRRGECSSLGREGAVDGAAASSSLASGDSSFRLLSAHELALKPNSPEALQKARARLAHAMSLLG